MPSRRPDRGSRRARLLAERLEPRRLLAADLSTGLRQLVWNGETVLARADGWIVTSERGLAPPARAGWNSRPLGEGTYAVTTPGACPEDVAVWAATAGLALEPDRIITMAALPNDPSFSRLWGLHHTGQVPGVSDADIDAPEAWQTVTGSRSVVVAVVDTGIDYSHPDLAANMWRNPREVAGDRIDNDGNGFVDDVYGWDFANNDADPFDDEGHGTHVAGTIGAVGNDGVGISGVNWQVSLMALKFLRADGSGTTSAAVAALNYATAMRRTYGVNVVATNNSWGGPASASLTNAIVAGGNAGILCVAAAGNESTNNDTTPSYPANINSDAVLSVAAIDSSNLLAVYSNYGATTVDVAAPGSSIYSTTPGNTYSTYSGTSMATPHVAGLVALLAAANPQATSPQIRSTILATTTAVSGLAGKVATGGVINAASAVAAISGLQPPPPPPPSGLNEPNDSLAMATAVTLASGAVAVSGTIGDGPYASADVDLYAVSVAAGSVLTVDIDASSLATPSSLDSYVRIFNASGAQVAFNDDGSGTSDSLATFTATASGTYYVGVSSYGNSGYSPATAGTGKAGSTTGNYTAKVSVAVPAPTADVVDVSPDPRTTSVSAVVVQFSRAVSGVDAADLSLTRGGAAVSLAGVMVSTTDNVRWTVAGLDAATASAGTYVLTLNAAGSGIVAVDGGALATSAFDTWTTQAATLVDAGDTLATAASLGVGSGDVRLSGRIGDGSFTTKDVDIYRVVLVAGQTLTVDIDAKTLSGGSSLDSYVRVFAPSGRQLAANDDDGVTYDSRLVYRANVAGTFFVGVSGYGNTGYSATRAGSGRSGSTGVYQVAFALSATAASRSTARLTGFRDGTRQVTADAAFAAYGINWMAALPEARSAGGRSRRC